MIFKERRTYENRTLTKPPEGTGSLHSSLSKTMSFTNSFIGRSPLKDDLSQGSLKIFYKKWTLQRP